MKKDESPAKTETSARTSDPLPVDAESPTGVSKEEKKRVVSLKVKKSVPARRAKTAPASVSKPTTPVPVDEPPPVPVDESTPVPVDEPASHTPVTTQPAESSHDQQPMDDHDSSRMKSSSHGLRLKKNSLNVDNGSKDLSLRKNSRFAAAHAIGETASSLKSVKIDADLLCFLGFGVGMTIAGVFLGYWTWRLLCKWIENPVTLLCQQGAMLLTSVFVVAAMLVWSLYLGMLTNGRQGFLKTLRGWLITMVISIIVLMCIGVKRQDDMNEAKERIRAQMED